MQISVERVPKFKLELDAVGATNLVRAMAESFEHTMHKGSPPDEGDGKYAVWLEQHGRELATAVREESDIPVGASLW